MSGLGIILGGTQSRVLVFYLLDFYFLIGFFNNSVAAGGCGGSLSKGFRGKVHILGPREAGHLSSSRAYQLRHQGALVLQKRGSCGRSIWPPFKPKLLILRSVCFLRFWRKGVYLL